MALLLATARNRVGDVDGDEHGGDTDRIDVCRRLCTQSGLIETRVVERLHLLLFGDRSCLADAQCNGRIRGFLGHLTPKPI